MSKNITTYELARMSQNEFTAVHGEIRDLRSEMNQNFEAVDKQFDRVHEQFDSLSKVVLDIKGLIENDTTQMKDRVTRIEETIGIGK